MDFDGRDVDTRNRIGERDRRMRIGPSIEYHTDTVTLHHGLTCFVDPVDEFTLVIRLTKLQRKPKLLSDRLTLCLNVLQGLCTVGARVASTQQVQVGAVQN